MRHPGLKESYCYDPEVGYFAIMEHPKESDFYYTIEMYLNDLKFNNAILFISL